MKKKLATLIILLFAITSMFAQSKSEIANVFIKRAWKKYNDIETRVDALADFNKALKYLDTITKPDVAKLGTLVHYEVGNWKKAKSYAQQYFNLSKNKKTDEYLGLVELFVTIDEEIEAEEKQKKQEEEIRIKKEKELRKIDSLKTIWNTKADEFAVKADSVYSLNANGYALFLNKGKYGIVNDKAETVVEANTYEFAISYGGFIIFQNKEKEPTKIYFFNTNNGSGNQLPALSDINPLSTHYGVVMLPRANGRLVTYPNNSFKPLVFDLNENKIVRVANKEDLLDGLKKNDRIRKFNKDGEVKIDKDWYIFGGHLGGGVHPLYFENNYNVHAYLFSIDGTVLFTNSDYKYIGAFYENKLQAIKGEDVFWINQNGTKVTPPKDKTAIYAGDSKVVKTKEGFYQVFRDDKIIKGDKTLEKLPIFLRNNK